MREVNLDEFFCPNEASSDYGKKERKGKHRAKGTLWQTVWQTEYCTTQMQDMQED